MEYGHRMWGRALRARAPSRSPRSPPRRWITRALAGRLFGFFGLGDTAQGVIGWWMVKSGLAEHPDAPTDVPRVSPYRLATHLTGAFTIYAAMIWTTFTVYFPAAAGGGTRVRRTLRREPPRGRGDRLRAVFRATESARARAHPARVSSRSPR